MSNQSPCKTCDRKDEDKRACSKICDRLEAWQDADPKWDEFRIPTPEELGETDGGHQKTDKKICRVDGCDAKVGCRGFCLKHYHMWRHKKLPGFSQFVPIQKHKSPSKNKPIKKAPREKTTWQPKSVTSSAKFQFNVDFTRYPHLRDLVVATAARFCVPPQHIIISLMGEGLAARQQED